MSEQITIQYATNGIVVSLGSSLKVFELQPGKRAATMASLLQEVACCLYDKVGKFDVRIDVSGNEPGESNYSTAPGKRLYSQEEVISIYGIPRGTLEEWRSDGKGPAYSKLGKRVYYRKEDLESFTRSGLITTTGKA